jgi:hypothetical protein
MNSAENTSVPRFRNHLELARESELAIQGWGQTKCPTLVDRFPVPAPIGEPPSGTDFGNRSRGGIGERNNPPSLRPEFGGRA